MYNINYHKKGGFLSSNEAVKLLWENETVNTKTLARYRKVAMLLNQTLSENGIEYIMENRDGNRRIVPEKINCDYYEYVKSGNTADGKNNLYFRDYNWKFNSLLS